MRAVRVRRFGGPRVLQPRDVPEPVPGPGQALVEVTHVDVLFRDALLRRGALPGSGVAPPYVPGGGVGGRVAATGAGVDPAWRGRRVIGRTSGGTGTGGYAERALLDADSLTAVPPGLAPPDAAALLQDGPTAFRLFDLAVSGGVLRPGGWALVLAAGGGLGALLVQLARAAGAHVVAAARDGRKLALLRDELGADAVVGYAAGTAPARTDTAWTDTAWTDTAWTDTAWTDTVREATGGKGVDVVFDGAGGPLGRAAFEVVARGGRFSAHGAPGGDFAPVTAAQAAERGVTLAGPEQLRPLTGPEAGAEAGALLERALLAAAGETVRPVVGQTFPLECAAEAHTAMEERTAVGKTLLTVG
ncbi:zinc-binding dehydrogenase [Streptomyces boncukensis]|uniref:Zinc-binding dehydrogenase n=1 Tax=Streptomyces boncukensis TaxID=2711219 RepID=A0A6G4X468_9ACTN|nr:zinc-binding dehydrogenase [Streptomyces boncukensis]NGO71534.1 zinc-binding dehydrogenase [Streptomyces boncukensis]